jgi:hypothetical protein
VDLRRVPATTETQLTVVFFAEPKLNIVQYPHYLRIDTAVDDLGQPVTITPPVEDRNRIRQTTDHRLVLPVKLPDHPGQKLRLLKGTADFAFAKGAEHIEVPDPTAGLSKATESGISIEVRPIARGSSSPSLTVRYHRSELDPDLWEKLTGPLLDLVPQVMSVSGQPFTSSSGSARMTDPDTVEVQRSYHDSASSGNNVGPEKIVIDIPTGIRPIHVPFEFKNLVLP